MSFLKHHIGETINDAPNFTVWELIRSKKAREHQIDNWFLDRDAFLRSCETARRILQPVRNQFGAFSPNSVYRVPELNALVGGSRDSQHLLGMAADFEVSGLSNQVLFNWCMGNLDYDQLILEKHNPNNPNSGWVHCSWSDNPRGEALTWDGQTYRKVN